MLGYTFFVLLRFLRRYYLARHELRADSPLKRGTESFRNRRKLIADLSRGLGTLRSIAYTAPFLGLAGTCYGIMGGAFMGFGMEKHSAMRMLLINIGISVITAAAGILVAIPATISHNLMRTWVEALRPERAAWRSIPDELAIRTRSVRLAQTLPLRQRFFSLPPFGVMAALVVSCLIPVFMAFEPYETPTGLAVAPASARCKYGPGRPAPDRLILLRITNSGQLFINMEPEDWKGLRSRLGEIYRSREYRELYMYAEDEVPFQTVADAVDIARSSPAPAPDSLDIKVVLVTPNAARRCVPIPVQVIRSGRAVK